MIGFWIFSFAFLSVQALCRKKCKRENPDAYQKYIERDNTKNKLKYKKIDNLPTSEQPKLRSSWAQYKQIQRQKKEAESDPVKKVVRLMNDQD